MKHAWKIAGDEEIAVQNVGRTAACYVAERVVKAGVDLETTCVAARNRDRELGREQRSGAFPWGSFLEAPCPAAWPYLEDDGASDLISEVHAAGPVAIGS